MNLTKHLRLSQLNALTQELRNEHNYYDLIVEHEGQVRIKGSMHKALNNQLSYSLTNVRVD